MPAYPPDYDPEIEPSPIPGQENRPYVAPYQEGPQVEIPTERDPSGTMAPEYAPRYYYPPAPSAVPTYPTLQVTPPQVTDQNYYMQLLDWLRQRFQPDKVGPDIPERPQYIQPIQPHEWKLQPYYQRPVQPQPIPMIPMPMPPSPPAQLPVIPPPYPPPPVWANVNPNQYAIPFQPLRWDAGYPSVVPMWEWQQGRGMMT